MAASNRLISRPVSKIHCAKRGLDIHVWASIWQWSKLVETRALCVVCHAFLRSFTLVQHVSISEDQLRNLESPYLEPWREPDVRLRLHRVFNFVAKRFRHIRTLRVYFSLHSRANLLKSPYEQGVSDSLARLLSSCAPELEELVIYFPDAAPERAKKMLLGPRDEYTAKNAARMEQLHDPVHTIGRHPLRRLCLSIPIPTPILNRLLGKLKHLQGFCSRARVCVCVCEWVAPTIQLTSHGFLSTHEVHIGTGGHTLRLKHAPPVFMHGLHCPISSSTSCRSGWVRVRARRCSGWAFSMLRLSCGAGGVILRHVPFACASF